MDGVPTSLRYSFAVEIGLFLTFIGLNETGVAVLGVKGAPVQAGHLSSPPALVALFGFVLLATFDDPQVPGCDSCWDHHYGDCRIRGGHLAFAETSG